ncbi:hypothetical protein [Pseudomonas sp. BN515]|uniref:hypothetical protein n=1 Tax=Pseudomonas sp. BN515 TaxID=2567892 RepID=UPI00245887E7|nr:hypothetical protein [Pseudomonas sp. BN515]MDH4872898.1 hypothetical protein [Pseudomonas sp. BN515]
MDFNVYSRKGWFRLWVVLSVLWGVWLGYIGYAEFPTLAKIDAAYTRDKIAINNEWQRTLSKHGGHDPVLEFAEKQVDETRRLAVQNLQSNQIEYCVKYLAIWIATSIAAYCSVLLFAWIIRGFRKQQA